MLKTKIKVAWCCQNCSIWPRDADNYASNF